MGAFPDNKDNESVYKHIFALPGMESYYSFDYGDAHFIVLDSEKFNEEQVRFVEEDLSKTDARWLFAVTHCPPYSSSHHPSDLNVRTKILPLLARHNVDLVIAGHNHNFMLSKPIRHLYEEKQTRPYIQMVTGGGGAYFADFRSDDRWFDRAFTAWHYVLINIDGEKLTAQAIEANGRKRDTLVIDRSQEPKNAVSFEQIELDRYLSGLTITNNNFPGWPTGYRSRRDRIRARLFIVSKSAARTAHDHHDLRYLEGPCYSGAGEDCYAGAQCIHLACLHFSSHIRHQSLPSQRTASQLPILHRVGIPDDARSAGRVRPGIGSRKNEAGGETGWNWE